jgi:hypothetical protein
MSRKSNLFKNSERAPTVAIAPAAGITCVKARALAKVIGVRRRGGRLLWTATDFVELLALVGDKAELDVTILPAGGEEE